MQEILLSYTICFCCCGDKILMLYRRYKPNQHRWNGLGGKIEEGETPLASVQREIWEELERGLNPQQVGIQNTNPASMSAQEAAQLTSYAQQQPGLLQQVMSNPMARTAVAGLVSYAAQQMLGNRGNMTGGGFHL